LSVRRYENGGVRPTKEKNTGVILDGEKHTRSGPDKLKNIPKSSIKQLLVLKDSSDVRKYFADTTIQMALVVSTKM